MSGYLSFDAALIAALTALLGIGATCAVIWRERAVSLLGRSVRSFFQGLAIIGRMKLLCFIITATLGVDIAMLFGDASLVRILDMGAGDLVFSAARYVAIAAGVIFLISLMLEMISGMLKERVSEKETLFDKPEDISRFSVFYSIQESTDRVVDILMLLLLHQYGFCIEMMVVQPLSLLMSFLVVQAHDRVEREDGYDLLKIGDVRNYRGKSKFMRLVLLNRWMVFFIGSLVVLDTDIVTLLLRKKGSKGYLLLVISSVYSITVWSVIYALGVEAYSQWFSWIPSQIQSFLANW